MFRTILIAAASVAAVSTAASAQYNPYQQRGYEYGYRQNYGEGRGLEQRIYNVMRSLDGVRPDQRDQIRSEAINLDRQLRYASRNGLNPYEAHTFDVRIDQLERQLRWSAGNRGYYARRGYGRWERDRRRD